MSVTSPLVQVKLRSSLDRCDAVLDAVRRVETKLQASPATKLVLAVLREIIHHLSSHLESFASDPDSELLTEAELERRLHFASQHIPYTYYLLGLVEKSDVSSVPADLIAPLRREVHRLLPNAELIVVSAPSLNYSIVDVGRDFRNLFERLNVQPPAAFPRFIYRIALPSVEFNQSLLHCILAHELGHPLYEERQVADAVFPLEVNKELLEQLAKVTVEKLQKSAESEDVPQIEAFSDPLLITKMLSARIHVLVSNWIMEVACDVFGLMLFGPAYLFANIYFSSGFQLLDSAWETHPPNRLRLRALFLALDSVYEDYEFSPTTKTMLEPWRRISEKKVEGLDIVEDLALSTIDENAALGKVVSAVRNSLAEDEVYGPDTLATDIADLLPLIRGHIPPTKMDAVGNFSPVELKSLLNVAWEEYLAGMTEFATNLPNGAGLSFFELTRAFNRFVMKAMEQNEVLTTWQGVRNDP